MTKFEFEIVCGEMLIDPAIALESEMVKRALAFDKLTKGDGEIVVRALDMEF